MSGLPPHLSLELARMHSAELVERAATHHRAAAARSPRRGLLARTMSAMLWRRRSLSPADPVVFELRIRYALAQDDAALRRLATLDSAPVPEAPLLVAEVEGDLHAALSLWDGRSIADPFRPTAALVELLVVRAAQLQSASAAQLQVRRPASLLVAAPEPGEQRP